MGDGMSATEIFYGQAVVPALRDSRLFGLRRCRGR